MPPFAPRVTVGTRVFDSLYGEDSPLAAADAAKRKTRKRSPTKQGSEPFLLS